MKTFLFILLSFVGITSLISGLLLMSNPDGTVLGLSPALLSNSPFKSYLVPGILLAGAVGAVNLIAVFYNIQRNKNRYDWAMVGGILVNVWVILQFFLIQVFLWFHFFYLAIGILIVLLAYQLKGKWAA